MSKNILGRNIFCVLQVFLCALVSQLVCARTQLRLRGNIARYIAYKTENEITNYVQWIKLRCKSSGIHQFTVSGRRINAVTSKYSVSKEIYLKKLAENFIRTINGSFLKGGKLLDGSRDIRIRHRIMRSR